MHRTRQSSLLTSQQKQRALLQIQQHKVYRATVVLYLVSD
jgi:hypothetical protein